MASSTQKRPVGCSRRASRVKNRRQLHSPYQLIGTPFIDVLEPSPNHLPTGLMDSVIRVVTQAFVLRDNSPAIWERKKLLPFIDLDLKAFMNKNTNEATSI